MKELDFDRIIREESNSMVTDIPINKIDIWNRIESRLDTKKRSFGFLFKAASIAIICSLAFIGGFKYSIQKKEIATLQDQIIKMHDKFQKTQNLISLKEDQITQLKNTVRQIDKNNKIIIKHIPVEKEVIKYVDRVIEVNDPETKNQYVSETTGPVKKQEDENTPIETKSEDMIKDQNKECYTSNTFFQETSERPVVKRTLKISFGNYNKETSNTLSSETNYLKIKTSFN